MSHAYGIGMITVVVAMSVCVVFYQSFYLPESLAKPSVPLDILEPPEAFEIRIVKNAFVEGNDNYVPSDARVVLSKDNRVVWINEDTTGHTVTSDSHYADPYSGRFDSPKTLLPGDTHEILLTEPATIEYHCIPHPWMRAAVTVEQERF